MGQKLSVIIYGTEDKTDNSEKLKEFYGMEKILVWNGIGNIPMYDTLLLTNMNMGGSNNKRVIEYKDACKAAGIELPKE